MLPLPPVHFLPHTAPSQTCCRCPLFTSCRATELMSSSMKLPKPLCFLGTTVPSPLYIPLLSSLAELAMGPKAPPFSSVPLLCHEPAAVQRPHVQWHSREQLGAGTVHAASRWFSCEARMGCGQLPAGCTGGVHQLHAGAPPAVCSMAVVCQSSNVSVPIATTPVNAGRCL